MPAYLDYNQLITTIIMVKQDVPNLPLMLPTVNANTSMMNHIYNNLLDRFPIVPLSKPLFIHLNIIVTALVTSVTHRIVISYSLHLTVNMDIHQTIIFLHPLLHSIIHVSTIRHLLL